MTMVVMMIAAVILIGVAIIEIGLETNTRLMKFRPRSAPLPGVIIYAVSLHLVWAIALTMEPKAGETTTLADLHRMFGAALPAILVCVAASAMVYLVAFNSRRFWPVLCVMPQQMIMTFSALTAINAMISGSFADGVLRSHAFIVADQAPALIATVLHTLAVGMIFSRSNQTREAVS